VVRAPHTIVPGGSLPDYVPPSADERLEAAVTAAHSGAESWIVVVQPWKVGKSRSLFEALCSCAAEALLVAPVGAPALRSLLTPHEAVGAAQEEGMGAERRPRRWASGPLLLSVCSVAV
jgi:hypothetical protein